MKKYPGNIRTTLERHDRLFLATVLMFTHIGPLGTYLELYLAMYLESHPETRRESHFENPLEIVEVVVIVTNDLRLLLDQQGEAYRRNTDLVLRCLRNRRLPLASNQMAQPIVSQFHGQDTIAIILSPHIDEKCRN